MDRNPSPGTKKTSSSRYNDKSGLAVAEEEEVLVVVQLVVLMVLLRLWDMLYHDF